MPATKIFVNLPVKNLDRTKQFFSKLGYSFNPQFTDQNAACLVISDDIYAMLITEAFFGNFTKKAIVDATKATEVIVALSTDSRADVDRIVDTALAAGATTHQDPQDHGFMYLRSFQDPDGHIWEYTWMDPSQLQK
jgi:uncharacterized protein